MIAAKIFKANDIRGVVGGVEPEWDLDGARMIGAATVGALGLAAGDTLVVGRDMRTTGSAMCGSFVEGVISQGVHVVDIGLCSTDGLWFASGSLHLPGAMFTASHNPAQYNGIKFCFAAARPVTSATLRDLHRRATGEPPPDAADRGSVRHLDLLGDYSDHLHSLVDLSGIRKLRVVVDAGNGMAGLTLPAVLGECNLDLISLYTDLDGTFPNHPPNPLEPENLVDAQNAVRENHADLALVFDGDADRCFIIDERGKVISPSIVTAMIAQAELHREPGATIIINKITSRAVAEVVEAAGGRTVVTKVGHTFVKAAMAQHDAIFGGEHSAHFYFRDFWGADTGMLAALHILRLAGSSEEPLSELAAGFSRYVESGEINSTVDDTEGVLWNLRSHFQTRGTVDTLDGLTVAGEDWWVNARPSNTEPLLRLNVEATNASSLRALRDEALSIIRAETRSS